MGTGSETEQTSRSAEEPRLFVRTQKARADDDQRRRHRDSDLAEESTQRTVRADPYPNSVGGDQDENESEQPADFKRDRRLPLNQRRDEDQLDALPRQGRSRRPLDAIARNGP